MASILAANYPLISEPNLPRPKLSVASGIVGMLGEAVKKSWNGATATSNTHTHNTHECKNIFFSKNPLKYIILVVFEIQKIKNHFKYTVITLDFVLFTHGAILVQWNAIVLFQERPEN